MESKYEVTCTDGVARVELAGRLDAANAPAFQEELKKLAGKEVRRIVFFAKDLEYISSAGLRTIIFAKQKLGMHAQVYLIQPQEAVAGVIKMSGLDNFLFIQDSYQD